MKESFCANDVVISSRIRLARNFKNTAFPAKLGIEQAFNLQQKVFDAIKGSDNFAFYQMQNLNENTKGVLLEKHLISKNLMQSKISALALNADESISIMINEEDHIREQCFKKGLNLKNAYSTLSKIDDEIIAKCDIAFDENLGFLTACPTNLGTGLRASCMLFLPALSLSGKMSEILELVKSKKQTIRGYFGEGSSALGSIYQISNQTTLGKSEWEIIHDVEQTIFEICKREIDERMAIFAKYSSEIKQKAIKSFNALVSGEQISIESFMENLAILKLYLFLTDDKQSKIDVLDSLVSIVQPCSLKEISAGKIEMENIDKFRGEYLQKILKNVIHF